MKTPSEYSPYGLWATISEDLILTPSEKWTSKQAAANVARLLDLMPERKAYVLDYLELDCGATAATLLAQLDSGVRDAMRDAQFSVLCSSESSLKEERIPSRAGICLATDAGLVVLSLLLADYAPPFEMVACRTGSRTQIDWNLPVLRCPDWPQYQWIGFYGVTESHALALADGDGDRRRSFLGLHEECARRSRASRAALSI